MILKNASRDTTTLRSVRCCGMKEFVQIREGLCGLLVIGNYRHQTWRHVLKAQETMGQTMNRRHHNRRLLIAILLIASLHVGSTQISAVRAEDHPKGNNKTLATSSTSATNITGSWKVIELRLDGQQMPFDRRVIYRFRDGVLNIGTPGHPSARLQYELGNSKSAFTVDLKFGFGKMQQTSKALYEIDGNRLAVCYPSPGQQRPTKLITRKGDRRTVIVFERTAARVNHLSDLIEAAKNIEK